MITITCDICGKPAAFGIDSKFSIYLSEKKELYSHHICRECAGKLGITPEEEKSEAPAAAHNPEPQKNQDAIK